MDNDSRYRDLLYNIQLGIRYHMWRQSFFERWHRTTGVLSLVGGSAAVASISASSTELATVFAGTIAITQAIDLLVDTRKYSELHKDLRRRYILKEGEISRGVNGEAVNLDEIFTDIKLIEAEEPPIRTVLMDICQNATLIAQGVAEDDAPQSYTRVAWYKRLFAHFI